MFFCGICYWQHTLLLAVDPKDRKFACIPNLLPLFKYFWFFLCAHCYPIDIFEGLFKSLWFDSICLNCIPIILVWVINFPWKIKACLIQCQNEIKGEELKTGSVMKRRMRRSRDCLKCMKYEHLFVDILFWTICMVSLRKIFKIKRNTLYSISVEIGWKWNRFCSSHTITIGIKRKAFVSAYHWSVKRKTIFFLFLFRLCVCVVMVIQWILLKQFSNSNNRFVWIKQWMGVERMDTFFLYRECWVFFLL